jgi:hypothetical protein
VQKECDVTRLNEVVEFTKHKEEVSVAEQGSARLLDEKVLRFGKRNEPIGIHRGEHDHERQRWKDAEEPTLKESADRHFAGCSLLLDHGEPNDKARHHKEHVDTDEPTTKCANANVTENDEGYRNCT